MNVLNEQRRIASTTTSSQWTMSRMGALKDATSNLRKTLHPVIFLFKFGRVFSSYATSCRVIWQNICVCVCVCVCVSVCVCVRARKESEILIVKLFSIFLCFSFRILSTFRFRFKTSVLERAFLLLKLISPCNLTHFNIFCFISVLLWRHNFEET